MDEEEAGALKAKLEEEDPVLEPFREISAHTGMPGTSSGEGDEGRAFLTKIVGDP